MPIKRCTLPNGKLGYKYGDSGKCYADGRDAARQGIAIEGSPEKFKKVMKSEGSKSDWVFVKAAIEEYEKENKLNNSNAFKSIASFLKTQADPGDSDSDVDKGDMLDENCSAGKKDVEIVSDAGNFSGDPKNTGDGLASGGVDSDDYGKGPGNDNDGDESDPEAKAALSDGKPSETVIDTDDPSNNKNGLDSDSKQKTGHVVVPSYNKSASPETDPSKTVPNVTPPTRDETTPAKSNVYSNDTEEAESVQASENTWKSIAYIPQSERDKIAEEDFAGPNRTFPCATPEQVKSASHLVGHSQNPTSVKRKIIEIARRKGYEHALPESWKHPDQRSSAYEQALAFLSKATKEEKEKLKTELEVK